MRNVGNEGRNARNLGGSVENRIEKKVYKIQFSFAEIDKKRN